MAYRVQINAQTCINCGICMDLCPVRCLDMTRPSGAGEPAIASERESPIPGAYAERAWMMLAPVQVASCIGCQVCAQECPTNAITITAGAAALLLPRRGGVGPLPPPRAPRPPAPDTPAQPPHPGGKPLARR